MKINKLSLLLAVLVSSCGNPQGSSSEQEITPTYFIHELRKAARTMGQYCNDLETTLDFFLDKTLAIDYPTMDIYDENSEIPIYSLEAFTHEDYLDGIEDWYRRAYPIESYCFEKQDGYNFYSHLIYHTPYYGVIEKEGNYYPSLFIFDEKFFHSEQCLITECFNVVEYEGKYAYTYSVNKMHIFSENRALAIYYFLAAMAMQHNSIFDIYVNFKLNEKNDYLLNYFMFLPKDKAFQNGCVDKIVRSDFTHITIEKLEDYLTNPIYDNN